MKKLLAGTLIGAAITATTATAGGWKTLNDGDSALAPSASAMCMVRKGNLVCGSLKGKYQVGISKHLVAVGKDGNIIWKRSI